MNRKRYDNNNKNNVVVDCEIDKVDNLRAFFMQSNKGPNIGPPKNVQILKGTTTNSDYSE